MSRIGKLPVEVPQGVEVSLAAGTLTVKGPKGTLSLRHHPEMNVVVDDAEVRVERPSDQKTHRALHGLTRALVANMVTGVTQGFTKTLEIQGVGYKAEQRGQTVLITVGFSHTVEYTAMEGVTVECPNATTIVVSGADKQKVGQTAAEIRAVRPPEPYKGKGIRYQGEQVRRKAGKTAGA
ncbi:MAG: 50S ribosomal protein L6 [Gemmatimonadetes bacterium]|nr:50S ribosomal protein L6 [Gemmatimonadota bacterium]